MTSQGNSFMKWKALIGARCSWKRTWMNNPTRLRSICVYASTESAWGLKKQIRLRVNDSKLPARALSECLSGYSPARDSTQSNSSARGHSPGSLSLAPARAQGSEKRNDLAAFNSFFSHLASQLCYSTCRFWSIFMFYSLDSAAFCTFDEPFFNQLHVLNVSGFFYFTHCVSLHGYRFPAEIRDIWSELLD